MQTDFFIDSSLVSSTRILYTPSLFARSSLFHLQETGTLQALHPHASARNGLVFFIFLMEDAWEAKDEREEEPLFSENIQEIKEYLDRNFRSKISLDGLAEKFFINKFYLSRIFKERYGTTIGTYLLQARVTYAKQQLRFTDRTLGEIAEDLQMEMNYLSRIFKKAEGVSPSVYRKQWRGSEK